MDKIRKNIWNIISVIGTIATLVFGIYGLLFVPNYIKDAYNERQKTANQEIINDIKEIIYSGIKTDSLVVPTLKAGKELKYDIDFPNTNRQILVEVQDEFMSDKFLALEQRMALFSKVDSLKSRTPIDELKVEKAESKATIFSILTYTLSILSLLISVLLIFGLFTRRKQQINEELENKFEEIQETRPESVNEYRGFESLVGKALSELKLDIEDFTKNPRDFSFDFLIKLNGKKIGIEVKSRIRQDVLLKMKNQFDNSGLDALIIVTNSLVDFPTFNLLSDLRKKTGLIGRKIYFISANNLDKLKTELTEIIKLEKE